MKIYSQTIDLSKTTPQNFYVPPNSKFKLGVKLVQAVQFSVKRDGVALNSDGEIDGFKTYSLDSTAPGNTVYVVEAANGQKVKILQTTTNSTVFDVEGGGGGGGVSEEYVDGKVQEEATARQNDVASLADRIPTKTSQLENDSGFLTHEGTIANAETANTANTASTVEWGGVQSKPTTLEGYGITDAATKAEIPTKTSELENDSGFLTYEGTIANADHANAADTANTANTANNVAWSGVQSKPIASATELGLVKVGSNLTIDADGKLNATGGGTGGVSQEYVDGKVQEEATARQNDVASLADRIPTKTSQLDNDSGFLTYEGTIANAENADTANTANSVAWGGVQDKPTSLTGYGITDAATKAELDSLAAVVGNANTQLEEIA